MDMHRTPNTLRKLLFALFSLMLFQASNAQPTAPQPISGATRLLDYVVYAEGNHPGLNDSVRYGVQVGNSSYITGGMIGSNFHVQLGSSINSNSHIFSGNRINFGSSNVLTGNMAARNDARVNFGVITTGGSGNIIGSFNSDYDAVLQARGHISLDERNAVESFIFVQQPFSYAGPRSRTGDPQILPSVPMPEMPSLPFPTTFPAAGTLNFTSTFSSLSPGAYGDVVLNGNSEIVFTQPGVYVFKSIKLSGRNNFNFILPAEPEGMYKIYVHGDMDVDQLNVLMNGNVPEAPNNFMLARYLYTEVHGTGSTTQHGHAFRVGELNGSPSQLSFWAGTVYAPYGSIIIGNPAATNSHSEIQGALWSKRKVVVGHGVQLYYHQLAFTPVVVDPYYPPPPGGRVQDKIGAELTSISQNIGAISSLPDNFLFRIEKATKKVAIEVIAKEANNEVLLKYLANNGFDTITVAPNRLILTGWFPAEKLQELNKREDVDYVRPLFEAISNAGQVTSQGDTTMRSHIVRSRFNVEGNGVTVGILSDSWNTLGGAPHDVAEGDLPADAVVALDFPLQRTDEGRAMGQIVHDVAPKAKLVFRTGAISPLDFSLGIRELAGPAHKCNVIVDDLTYITEPFMKDGLIAQAVNDVVRDNGVTYITAAGNFGSKSFEGTFAPVTGLELPPGISGTPHNFGGTIRQRLLLKRGSYTIVLQWDDNFYSLEERPGALNDLDIYLLRPGTDEFIGFNRNNITADPFEVMPFNVNEDTEVELLIVRKGGSANVRFKYIVFRGEATIEGHAGSSTITGQGNAEKAITVGAMLYDNVNNIVPDYPSVASFSSRGGTRVNGVVRQKPNLVGPNGVNTTVTFSTDPATNIDNDPFPNFYGTSAAAPHVAGVAALLIEGRKKFSLKETVNVDDVDDIKTMMQSTALDLHEPGFDFKSGAGAVQADAAMLTIANARPLITALEAPAGLALNNTTPFELKVKGRYLNAQTKIYLRGAEIPTTLINNTLVSATINGPISDDPAIQLYNPPRSPSNLDGGLSEALYLFSNKKLVLVKAENKTKKYGQSMPDYGFTVTVDGQPLANTGETLNSLRLDGGQVQFTTLAGTDSHVGNYSLTPGRTAPLDPSNPADAALLAKFNFVFEAGTLTVQKLPLKITPKNQTISYGEIPNLFDYQFDFGGLAVSATVKQALESAYRQYMADNTLVVVNGLSSPLTPAILARLHNMSTMSSFQALRNARKFYLENGQLLPQPASIPADRIGDQRFLVDLAAQSLTNYSLDSASIQLVPAPPENKLRGLISARALANGTAQANLPNGQLQPVVNGQLLPVVNGQLRAVVNGQLQAIVNGVMQDVEDLLFFNGQLRAVVNGAWVTVTNGQLQAVVNGLPVTVQMSVANGQLQAVVNGQLMALVNGQLRAVVNGQTLDLVNGQLQAVVNGQLLPVVNGQLRALVNGQLMPVVNGQLLAIVNGALTVADYVEPQANGQLMAMVNGQLRPIVNGQLLAVVNGQLMSMVNGQLMAVVNGRLYFAYLNGQIRAVVNGVERDDITNGQIRAVVNGSLQNVTELTITNGQLRAVVNGQAMDLVNGQLRPVVNGQLQPVVNNFGDITNNSNSQAAVVIDGEDLNLQGGSVGGMFAVNTITGLNPGLQKLIPGSFFDPNVEVSYGMADVTIVAGLTDDVSTATVWYRDFDGDGFGNPTSSRRAVSQPAGFVANNLDCNDYRTHYEDLDNDGWGNAKKIPCGVITRTGDCNDNDRRVHSLQTFYRDADGDSYGDAARTIVLCSSIPPAGYVANRIDCNDSDASVHWFITYYRDADGDGLGDKNQQTTACSRTPPQGYVNNSKDTDDSVLPPVVDPSKTVAKGAVLEAPVQEGTSVYPNPARDRVRLQTAAPLSASGSPVISDASGRTFTGLPSRRINERTVEVSIATLPSGLYMVQVKTAEGLQTLRFTKL